MVIAVCLVLAILFLFHQHGRRESTSPTPTISDPVYDFSWVSGQAITEQPRPAIPLFKLETFGDMFSVQEDPASSSPGLRYSLHATLTGANLSNSSGQFFGCFLARWPNGTHVCTESAALKSGKWHVNVTLIRIPASKPTPECVPSSSKMEVLSSPSSSILDYILQGNFPTFKHYLKCMKYPYQPVLEGTWMKKETQLSFATKGTTTSQKNKASSRSVKGTMEVVENPNADQQKRKCRGPGGPGAWIEHSGSCKDSGLCIGEITDTIKFHKSNKQRNMKHIFAPFSCRPRFFPTQKARTCVNNIKLAFSGDSRTLHFVSALQEWLGSDFTPTFFPLYRPYRLGLTHALATPAGDALREAIRSNRTVIINSVLHDVAEFYSTTTAADVIHSWSKYVTCADTCNGKLALDCGCRKTWAIRAYLDAITQLGEDIKSAREEALKTQSPLPRVFWVSLHKRAPSPPDVFYDWQTADVVWELESAAAALLETAGVEHIDLRSMTGSAPSGWWDDAVHFGREKSSLFLHSTLQAILSRVCETDE